MGLLFEIVLFFAKKLLDKEVIFINIQCSDRNGLLANETLSHPKQEDTVPCLANTLLVQKLPLIVCTTLSTMCESTKKT